ncbi:hypothetical protein BI330_07350 [Mycobacterium sp. CBMA 623]|nr:hypothetical protein [Mycobacteroides sp. CBMA 326]
MHLKGRNELLPLKTTIDDFDALGGYLKTQVSWVSVGKVKATIDPKHADKRKLDAATHIGFLQRDGENLRLTDLGRTYANATEASVKAQAMLEMLLSDGLYSATVHWMHFNPQTDPTKTAIGVYWHDHHGDKLGGAQGDGLTDAVVFFLRLAGSAGLGKYIGAGNGRPETYLKGDASAIERAATTTPEKLADTPTPNNGGGAASGSGGGAGPDPTPTPPPAVNLQTSPAVHVNIEIHIAADANAATVEEIFKNMRRYVLNAALPEDGE